MLFGVSSMSGQEACRCPAYCSKTRSTRGLPSCLWQPSLPTACSSGLCSDRLQAPVAALIQRATCRPSRERGCPCRGRVATPSHPEACCHTRSGAIDTISWSSPLAYALGALPFPVLPGLRRAIAYRNILVGWSIGAVARTMSRVSDDFSEVSRVPGPSARRENLPGIDC
jgi:hypothetical protein